MDLNGIVLLDKGPGITSFEAVNKVKKILKAKKAGHSGTLDKFASGLLIICLDNATAIQNIFMNGDKVYRASIRFGEQTDTLDPYGKIIKKAPIKKISKSEVIEVLNSFVGEIEQCPPVFSAIRIDGKRLYKRALSGEDIKVSPRKIKIHWINLVELQENGIVIEAKVSKGTYIRSLARDIAMRLGTVGYCESLRRLSIGNFDIENSVRINEVTKSAIIPIEDALSFLPQIVVDKNTAIKVNNGFPAKNLFSDNASVINDRYIRVLYNGNLIAILEKNNQIKYFRVLGMR